MLLTYCTLCVDSLCVCAGGQGVFFTCWTGHRTASCSETLCSVLQAAAPTQVPRRAAHADLLRSAAYRLTSPCAACAGRPGSRASLRPALRHGRVCLGRQHAARSCAPRRWQANPRQSGAAACSAHSGAHSPVRRGSAGRGRRRVIGSPKLSMRALPLRRTVSRSCPAPRSEARSSPTCGARCACVKTVCPALSDLVRCEDQVVTLSACLVAGALPDAEGLPILFGSCVVSLSICGGFNVHVTCSVCVAGHPRVDPAARGGCGGGAGGARDGRRRGRTRRHPRVGG